MKTRTIGGQHIFHQDRWTDDWQTPPEIIEALGPFDLDPCASVNQIHPTAAEMWTTSTHGSGLLHPWPADRRVWLNPPYGRYIGTWMRRMVEHHCGTALVYARTETEWFQHYVFPVASALLFLEGRLFFLRPDGSRPIHNAGGPSVLVAYSRADAWKLKNSDLPGHFVRLRR